MIFKKLKLLWTPAQSKLTFILHEDDFGQYHFVIRCLRYSSNNQKDQDEIINNVTTKTIVYNKIRQAMSFRKDILNNYNPQHEKKISNMFFKTRLKSGHISPDPSYRINGLTLSKNSVGVGSPKLNLNTLLSIKQIEDRSFDFSNLAAANAAKISSNGTF